MKRLLVIRFSALGDVAILVPVIRVLATRYPEWEITILSRSSYASLFRYLPANVHFTGADLRGKHKGKDGLDTLLREIDYQRFDAVADLHRVWRSLYLSTRMRLSGKKVAWIHKAFLSKGIIVNHISLPTEPITATYQRYEKVFNQLGFELNIQPNAQESAAYTYTLPATAEDEDTLSHSIGIAPFAAHKGKIYPLSKMETAISLLSEHITAEGGKIYLFGAGEREHDILSSWAKKYKDTVSLAGKYDMGEEIAIMSKLRLMLTMDSGNMHLASIAGTRVISIWGATHPDLGFLGYGQSLDDCIQKDADCRPCSVFGNKPCKYGDYRCLDIEPEEIVNRVMQAYEA